VESTDYRERAELLESTIDRERAVKKESTVVAERAVEDEGFIGEKRVRMLEGTEDVERAMLHEGTVKRERAERLQGTEGDDRAIVVEGTVEHERAVVREGTSELERAGDMESTIPLERAIDGEGTKKLERASELELVVFGHPEPRGSKTPGIAKNGRRFVRDSNPKSYGWMDEVAKTAGMLMMGRPLLMGPLRCDIDFYQARPKGHYGTGRNAGVVKASAPARPITAPDALKLARGTIDAMEKMVFGNDAQIVEGDVRKFFGTPERCEIRIRVV